MSHDGTGPKRRRKSAAAQIAQGYRTAHEILSAALSMGLLTGGGYWLDQKVGWTPVLTICGAVLGFVVAGVSLRALLRRLDHESAEEKRAQRPAEEEIKFR